MRGTQIYYFKYKCTDIFTVIRRNEKRENEINRIFILRILKRKNLPLYVMKEEN